MWKNIKLLFSDPRILLGYVVMVGILAALWIVFTDYNIMFGNYGTWHTSLDIALSWIVILGFPLFILAWIYRSMTFGVKTKKKESAGFLGGIIAVIISGSSCCGATLAMYFGFTPLMMMLPYSGLELKLVAVIGLLYALYTLLSKLTTCSVQLKK